MFKAIFYPREVKFYTDNVRVSVTNSMSALLVGGLPLTNSTSNSEYLVRNPVQAALYSNKRQKAIIFFEYFWLGMTLRPEGSRNLF